MNLSEPQLISPLLDGFVMGDPINSHDGVRSCPAMQLETDKKYIVKIISLPATQAKLDALLLAGAFTDRESALDYFRDLADGVIEEAALLQRLSKHEGFVSFENWQVVSMEDDETGFDIYLLGEYRPTLEGVLRNNEMTHLQAINLGLDLCAALSVSRRFGYLYGNLRPTNIYICNEREFRIGDLGFLSLDSLPYASLPDKYHSDYTPPEICDAYSALNSTMDTYAIGMILYQAYNDGKLPPVGMPLDAPCHADFALAEIILKACALDPEERWQDPVQMGQALANYLQNNSVNDTPIAPLTIDNEEPEIEEVPVEEDTEPSTEDILAEVDQALESAPPVIPAESEEVEEVPAEEDETADVAEKESEDFEVSEDFEEEAAPAEDAIAEAEESNEENAAAAEEASTEETSEEESTEEDCTDDEPAVDDKPVDETAQMLAQADDLIAHQLPEPPVAPEPIEVTLPVPEEAPAEEAVEDKEASAETPANTEVAEETAEDSECNNETPEDPEDADDEPAAQPKKRRKGLVTLAIVLAAVLLLATAAIFFYQHFYLQTIHDIVLSGTEDRLTVTLTTDTADEKLTVKCTDTHGNSLTAPVENGAANFVGLKPGTTYKLEVRVNGFHKLLGETTQTYITATQTTIDGFYAATGPEDGSVILSFTHQGPDSVQWRINYSADSEETKNTTFNGHMVTITGLTVGKEYTFTLEPVTELYLNGTTTITHTASNIIYAENVEILGFTDNRLAVTWGTPQGVTVSNWYVRCYNDAGYDKTLSATENTVYFEDLDIASAYTIEVTAEGMTLGTRTYLSANSVTIQNIHADASDRNNLKVTWDFEGTAPTEGWLLLYTVDGGSEQQVVQCTEAFGIITPLIPGAHYSITVQPTGSITPFGGTLKYDAPEAAGFSGYLVSAENIDFSMCKTPNVDNWDRHDVASKNYTTSFPVGVSASFVMHLDRDTSKSDENVVALYVIRDAEGKLISCKYESRTWNNMWYNRYGKLTIPVMPETPGKYTVAIYFNGTCATTQSFEILAN